MKKSDSSKDIAALTKPRDSVVLEVSCQDEQCTGAHTIGFTSNIHKFNNQKSVR